MEKPGSGTFKFLFIPLLYCLLATQIKASHIVGGEFELIHLHDSTYILNLNLYFDVINGLPGAVDPSVTVNIFEKGSNQFLRSYTLPLSDSSAVEFFQPECSNGSIATSKLFYTLEIILEPGTFNNPQGYYVSWERCCRNYNITNVVSEDPNTGGQHSGQTFYLEFPPVVKNGEPFINSSPILFPPLSDFGCPNRQYWVDFQGFDPDGDSIVYSLAEPFTTILPDAIPSDPNPGPYPPVIWEEGFGPGNFVNGNPDLAISQDGLLTVTPTVQGLFVFSVKAVEFRDRLKIGEVRRDFQFFVTDCPPPGSKPNLVVTNPQDGSKIDDIGTITFDSNDEKCITFQVSDPNASEKLQIRARPINFFQDISSIFTTNLGFTDVSNQILEFEACLPECPFVNGDVAVIDFVAFDGTCPLPLVDTVRIIFEIEPPENNAPSFVSEAEIENITIPQGQNYSTQLVGLDTDMDSMTLVLVPDGFDPLDFGMELQISQNEAGETRAVFQWDTDCQRFDFASRNQFNLSFVLEDLDQCGIESPDVFELNLEVVLPENTNPVISTNKEITQIIELEPGEVFNLEVLGTDADNDSLSLSIEPLNFNPDNYPFAFQATEGRGEINSDFRFDYTCELASENMTNLVFSFKLEDSDLCKESNADEAFLVLALIPPQNKKPEIFSEVADSTLELMPDDILNFIVTGSDSDNNKLELSVLEAIGFGNRIPYDFSTVTGLGSVTSNFEWEISCADLRDNIVEEPYQFRFIVKDSSCQSSLADTLQVDVVISDGFQEFIQEDYPNVFTPNGDDKNAVFFIPNLPEDNCANQFEKLSIVNRWGREVFQATSRNFVWDGIDEPTGVYYWNVSYTNRDISGWVHLIR